MIAHRRQGADVPDEDDDDSEEDDDDGEAEVIWGTTPGSLPFCLLANVGAHSHCHTRE